MRCTRGADLAVEFILALPPPLFSMCGFDFVKHRALGCLAFTGRLGMFWPGSRPERLAEVLPYAASSTTHIEGHATKKAFSNHAGHNESHSGGGLIAG